MTHNERRTHWFKEGLIGLGGEADYDQFNLLCVHVTSSSGASPSWHSVRYDQCGCRPPVRYDQNENAGTGWI